MSETQAERRRHVGLAAGLAVVCLAACGPAGQDADPFAELEGKVLSDAPFLVVPNRAWRRDERQGTWYFESRIPPHRPKETPCHVTPC